MKEEGVFFLKVGAVCTRQVVTCSPERNLAEVAGLMRASNVSGIVVCRADGTPAGVITDRDIRNRLALAPADIRYFPASALMTSPVITLGEGEYVFEAVRLMARHNIHRLVIAGKDGKIAGILTNTDVLNLQSANPLYFGREIEAARTLDELKRVSERVAEIVSFGCRAGARMRDIVILISRFYAAVIQRVISLVLEEEQSGAVPPRFAYLALGSGGRQEQTLKTDHDSALVYADDLTPEELAALDRFSVRLGEALVAAGVPACPGGTTANNPAWRKRLSEWLDLVERWISVPSPEHQVTFGMFCDMRTVHGDPSFEQRIKARILDAVGRNALFLPHMARNILRFPPPLGFFGGVVAERSGENKGKLDLKKSGLFALVGGVTLLGLEAGMIDGGTRSKIAALGDRGALPKREADQLDETFNTLMGLRLASQLREVTACQEPTNLVDLRQLTASERQRLTVSLQSVRSFQSTIRERFQVEFIAR